MNKGNLLVAFIMMAMIIYFGYTDFNGVVPLPYIFLFFGGSFIVIYETCFNKKEVRNSKLRSKK